MTARETVLRCLGLMLLCNPIVSVAVAQPVPIQRPATAGQAQRQIPIEHYYWHFLIHQNDLDLWAEKQASKGHDGSALRNHIQRSLGLTDADYAPVRASSARVAAEAKRLNAQVAAIRAAGPTATSTAQLKALTLQKDAAIKSEVSYLRKSLSPEKTSRLELFMVQFFSSPKTAHGQSPSAQRPATGVVQP